MLTSWLYPYTALLRRRKQIDAAFGGPLHWLRQAHDLEDQWPSPALVWALPCPPLRDLDRSQWPTLQAQMIDAIVRLERAVVPHLDKWLSED